MRTRRQLHDELAEVQNDVPVAFLNAADQGPESFRKTASVSPATLLASHPSGVLSAQKGSGIPSSRTVPSVLRVILSSISFFVRGQGGSIRIRDLLATTVSPAAFTKGPIDKKELSIMRAPRIISSGLPSTGACIALSHSRPPLTSGLQHSCFRRVAPRKAATQLDAFLISSNLNFHERRHA
jgi:hypothetical protein